MMVSTMALTYVNQSDAQTETWFSFPAILAANGADLNAETKAGYTPLHVACHFGSVNMVRFLLERDVNVDVQVGSPALCFKRSSLF